MNPLATYITKAPRIPRKFKRKVLYWIDTALKVHPECMNMGWDGKNIDNAFWWEQTPQGDDFWQYLHEKFIAAYENSRFPNPRNFF